jgi:hypothetical protein
MTEERDLLEVVRTAARARSGVRREMRERARRQRQRLAGTLQDPRRDLGQRLLLAAGLGQAELDSMRKREEHAVRTFLEEERRAIAGRPRRAGLDHPLRLRRHSPFPDAPQLGFKLVQLDSATFIGPPVDMTGSDSRNLVVPDSPAPGRNFSRALVTIPLPTAPTPPYSSMASGSALETTCSSGSGPNSMWTQNPSRTLRWTSTAAISAST